MTETLPSVHVVGDANHTPDHNTIRTAIGNIDTRLAAVEYVTANAQTGNYTLVLADAGKSIDVTSASAAAVTVPPNSSVAFPIGTVVAVAGFGAGTITITAGAGVTINPSTTLTLRAQWSAATLRKTATNTWLLAGDIA